MNVFFCLFVNYSGKIRDGKIEAAEHGSGKDLEALRHRQGRLPRLGGVRAGHAPHKRQTRRPRATHGASRAPRAAVQTRRVNPNIRLQQIKVQIITNSTCVYSSR